jgi:hypothetical protein
MLLRFYGQEMDKDVEERNNIIQSVTGKGHSNAWPGTASIQYSLWLLPFTLIKKILTSKYRSA